MATLGTRIKELRNEKDLSQESLGKIFGIVKSTVSLYENDKSTPDDEIKKKMANYFNVSLDYLMGESVFRNYEEEEKYRMTNEQYQEEIDIVNEFRDAFKTFIVNNIYDKSQITNKLKELLDGYNAYDPGLTQPKFEEIIDDFVDDIMPYTNLEKCEKTLHDLGYEDKAIIENDFVKPIVFLKRKYQEVDDIEDAMKIILEQPGLMLKGSILSDESKIILANAIQMGLRTAEELEKKRNKGDINE